MQIRFISAGIGAAVPSLKFGINIVNGVYLMIRDTPQAKPYVMGIASGPGIGGANGSLAFSYIETNWINLDFTKHPWLCSKGALIGRTVEVTFASTLIIQGHIDISFKLYDGESEVSAEFSKINIKASGVQLVDSRVRGTLKSMMGKVHEGHSAICTK